MNKIKQQFNNIFKQLKKLLKYDYYKQIFKKQNTIPMTLCIAKKYGRHVEFASDSRLTFNDNKHIDIGIKVFSIPLSLQDSQGVVIYQRQIGICVAGNTNAIYNVKDSIFEMLQNLQYANGWTDLSFKNIVSVIGNVFKHCVDKIIPVLMKDGMLEVIIGGESLDSNTIEIYKLSIKTPIQNFDNIEIKCEEILKSDGIEFIGSGSKIADDIYKNNSSLNIVQLMKKVIDSGNDKNVGGAIQFGEFINGNFNVKGIAEIDNVRQTTKYNLRGLDMYNTDFTEKDFIIKYNYKICL